MEEKKMVNAEELAIEVQNETIDPIASEEANGMAIVDDNNGGIGCC